MPDPTPRTPRTPRIVHSLGSLPPFREHAAIFMANLLGLFFGNEEKQQILAERVGEVDSYGGRLLPILNLLFQGQGDGEGGDNLLVLERKADPALSRFFEEGLGLSLPRTLVLPHEEYLEIGRELAAGTLLDHDVVDQMAAHPAEWMDGYVTDETLAALADAKGKRTLSTAEGSYRGNNKLLLYEFVLSEGLPVIPTELAESPAEVAACLDRLRANGFDAAVVKSPIGASGIGLFVMESIEAFQAGRDAVPDYYWGDGPCMVQGWLKPGERGVGQIWSPSVQLYLDPDRVTLYDLTEQILRESSLHEGNESPPPWLYDRPDAREEILRQAGMAGGWLHAQGYRGTASVDFLVTEAEDGPDRATVYICEINARVTGATYPSVLAHHLVPSATWLMQNLRFDAPMEGQEILDRLARGGDLFRVPSDRRSGVVPINFNFGEDGLVHKGQFLCLAPTTQGSEFLLHMAGLDLPCVRERD